MEFIEFFAGGGMARLGLGNGWHCTFANDISEMKAAAYRANHDGGHELVCGSITDVAVGDIPGHPVLAWGSFPCQDLSLAGRYAGLQGERSALFWEFWRIVQGLVGGGRAPKVVILENVYGTLTSRGGDDLLDICRALSEGGYRYGPLVVDAVHFVPQSRPRLFIVGVHKSVSIPAALVAEEGVKLWTPEALRRAKDRLSGAHARDWVWWNLPAPPPRPVSLDDIVEDEPEGVRWHTPAETAAIIGMMSDHNRQKLDAAKKLGCRVVGTIYRRTRPTEDGGKIQRAEVRFDGIAGCLRTPKGGSSRQTIMVVDGDTVRTRLVSPREVARLMGLPETYQLPSKYNDAYFIAGDGVAVPVVRYITANIVEPIVSAPPREVAYDAAA